MSTPQSSSSEKNRRAHTSSSLSNNRTESKSGFDKSLRKGGAGGHNWGSIRDELDHELEDNVDLDDADELDVDANDTLDKTNAVLSDEDVKKARELREQGLDKEGTSAACVRIYASLTSLPFYS